MNKGSTSDIAAYLKSKYYVKMNQPILEEIIKNIITPVSYI